jgi:hypothetical protein
MRYLLDPDAGNRDINVPNVPTQEAHMSKLAEGKSKKDNRSATKREKGP